MNWFRQLKIALPLAPRPTGVSYVELGHCNYDASNCPEKLEREELWAIDADYQLHTTPSAPDKDHVVFQTDPLAPFKWEGMIASGRYTKSEQYPDGAASVVVGPQVRDQVLKQKYIQKRIEKILEQHYGPQVQLFSF